MADVRPYGQLRFALAYADERRATVAEVDRDELRALLDERARLRARIHQLQHEADQRCAPIERERDELRSWMDWARRELNRGSAGGTRRYWSLYDTATMAVILEERSHLVEALAGMGKYLQMIGPREGDSAADTPV